MSARDAESPGVRRAPAIWRLVVRRALLGLVTLFVVSLVVFGATQALPGDPAHAILGHNATPESLAALRRQLHLDRPVATQYELWLRGVFSGDLGRSLASGRPATELIGKRVENSAVLVLTAALISIPLAIVIGSVAAHRRDRLFDHATSLVLLALVAVPEFVLAVGLVVLLATTVLHWLPAVSVIPPHELAWSRPRELVLPVATLVLAVVPYTARILRSSMLEVLESDYVEMARLKGLSERTVLWRHALPNALPAAIQVIALTLAYLTGGIVVIEFVFSYPGIGSAFVDGVSNRDLPVVQALALFIGAVYVGLNACADIATIFVTPRRRTSFR